MRWLLFFFPRSRPRLFCGEDEGHDETVEPQHLGEDQDEDHAHEEPGLLGGAPHAGVAHDADGEAGRQAAQAHAQAGAQVQEAPVGEGSRRESFACVLLRSGCRAGRETRLAWSQRRKLHRVTNIPVWEYLKTELCWT